MKYQEKIKILLQKYVTNNLKYKIWAILFAFALWLVILNITDPETTKVLSNITVKIENEQLLLDGTHVYTITSGETTSVTVTGKRSIITNLSIKDFLVKANFAELSITNAVPITVELTGTKARYANQISIIPKDTSMLINLEELASKQIPVEIQYIGDPQDGIIIDEANLQPKKITLTAAASIVESAEKAVVVANYNEIEDGTELVLSPTLHSSSGAVIKLGGDTTIDDSEILVDFKASYGKQVPINVELSGKVASGYKLDGFELSQDTIGLKGEKEDIGALESINVSGDAISIDGLSESCEIEVDVTPFLPEGISVYGESPMIIVNVNISAAE